MTFDFSKLISDLGQAVSAYGLAVVLLLIVVVAALFFLYKFSVFFRDKIATPIVDSHLKFVASVAERIGQHSFKLDKMSEEMLKQSKNIEAVPKAIADQTIVLKDAIERQGAAQRRQDRRMDGK